MPTTSKRDLARYIAENIGCRKGMGKKVVDALFESMRETLSQGNRIEIRGFGVLSVKDAKAKPAARNPRTGETIYVPARRNAHFKPGRLLKQAMREAPQ